MVPRRAGPCTSFFRILSSSTALRAHVKLPLTCACIPTGADGFLREQPSSVVPQLARLYSTVLTKASPLGSERAKPGAQCPG